MKLRNNFLAGAMILASVAPALAGGFLTNGLPNAGGSQYPTTVPLTGSEQAPFDTQLPSGLNPQSEAITTSQLAAFAAPQNNPRNVLDNGSMGVNQQGTGIITGGTTSITALQFAADRWFIDTNVGSGTGRGQVITASPAPPTGFAQSVKMYRNSGALTQPVCTLQAMTTERSTAIAGKSVVLSAYLDALAGLTSAGSAVSLVVIAGTGTSEGLATLTASPAITPAWTGITTLSTTVVNISTTWARYYTPAVLVPTTATEVGVEICFTPVGSSSGVTDGIAYTGVQLEAVGAGASSSAPVAPSPFEFQQYINELHEAQRFFWELSEANVGNGGPVAGFCQALTGSTNTCTISLPVQMRGTLPTITIGTAGTFKVNIANTLTTIATPTAGVCSTYACTVTAGNTNTAGQVEQLTSAGGVGIWTVSNDKVM